MLEILKFAFSGFWSFVGTLFVLATIFNGISLIIKSSISLARYKRIISLLKEKNLQLDLELSKYDH